MVSPVSEKSDSIWFAQRDSNFMQGRLTEGHRAHNAKIWVRFPAMLPTSPDGFDLWMQVQEQEETRGI